MHHWFACRSAVLVLVLGGCTPLKPPGDHSPLVPPRMSPDSVVVDIFFVRFPFGDDEANGPLWDEVDEQHFPTELRRELDAGGFRAGAVGCQMPVTLSKLLELSDKPPPTEQVVETSLEDLDSTPTVVRRHKQLRAGKPCEIQASGVYEELPVVMCRDGQLCGRSYENAQAVLVLKAFPEADGRVRLEIVPEVHHGQQRKRFVGSHGALRMDVGRARRVFDELTLSARLSVGQMIVLSSLESRPGSLGHHFFTRDNGSRERQLIVVRLAQTQHQSMFSPESD